jgi:arylsulfatase A-like enzyme
MSDIPNIVFVHVDQMCHDAISALDSPWVQTPNIDRIMADGTAMLRAYSANPVCCPARASWYTGRMSSEHNVTINKRPILSSLPDLGQWMSPRGYNCYYTGKWHVTGRDVSKSFQMLPGGHGHGERGDASVASAACGFLTDYEEDKPFFLNVGFLNPHDCCYLTFAPQKPATKFGIQSHLGDNVPPVPGGFQPDEPFHNPEGLPMRWNADGVRLYNYYYYRMVEMVDAEVGRVYDTLRNSRHARDTLFIFTSDHGEFLGNRNKFKKGQLYEPAMHVPLSMVWPGHIPAGRRDDQHFTSGVDIPATILDAANLEPMPDMSYAHSLLPLCGESRSAAQWRDTLIAESGSKNQVSRSVHIDNCKAIFEPGSDVQVFDLDRDPHELENVAESPDYAGLLQRARTELAEYMAMIDMAPSIGVN